MSAAFSEESLFPLAATRTCASCGAALVLKRGETKARFAVRQSCGRSCATKYRRSKEPKRDPAAVRSEKLALCKAWYRDNKDRVREYRIKNRERRRAWARNRYATNVAHREKVKALAREANKFNRDGKENARMVREYGITMADYNRLLASQGGGCAICARDRSIDARPAGRRWKLSVDHDHLTGGVRGLLCSSCNFGIGKFRDDPALLESAAAYLRRSR